MQKMHVKGVSVVYQCISDGLQRVFRLGISVAGTN